VNALLDDAQEVEKVVSDDEEVDLTKNLIVRINEETNRRVTAVVKGVLKKMNKTYGGSLVQKKDMMPKTLEKFKQFCKNNDVSKAQEEQYRVFVPYNIQMPQSIMKTKNPAALENKRLIVRFSTWKATSSFPTG